MAVGENDGYDKILRKISRYDTVPKCFAVFNFQQSKINAAFSLMPSHAFSCIRTPTPSPVVDGIRTPSITFDACDDHFFISVLTYVWTSSSSS